MLALWTGEDLMRDDRRDVEGAPASRCLIAATAVATGVATAVLNAIGEGRGIDHALGPFGAVLFVISVAAPASVGLFVALRQPGNRVAWILLVGSLSVAVVMAAAAVADLALEHDRDSSVGAWAALLVAAVAGAVPVAARAGVRVPGRAAAVAALAAGRRRSCASPAAG